MQEQVEQFILQQANTAAAMGPAEASQKRNRANAAAAPAAKAARTSASHAIATSADVTGDGAALTEDGLVRCTVSEFKGKTYVNIRTYYMVRGLCFLLTQGIKVAHHNARVALPALLAFVLRLSSVRPLVTRHLHLFGLRNTSDRNKAIGVACAQKNEERLPTKKGVMLTPSEWQVLASSLEVLRDALANATLDTVVELSATRKATISDYKKNALSVDVREWYEKDGEWKPGQKGISLNSNTFEVCALLSMLPPRTARSQNYCRSGLDVYLATASSGCSAALALQIGGVPMIVLTVVCRRWLDVQKPCLLRCRRLATRPAQRPLHPLSTQQQRLLPQAQAHLLHLLRLLLPHILGLAQSRQMRQLTVRRFGSSVEASLRV